MFTIMETELDFTQSNPATVAVLNNSQIVAARLVQKGTDSIFILWLMVDLSETVLHDRTFALVATGQPFSENVKKYIGTFLMGSDEYKHVVELEV